MPQKFNSLKSDVDLYRNIFQNEELIQAAEHHIPTDANVNRSKEYKCMI